MKRVAQLVCIAGLFAPGAACVSTLAGTKSDVATVCGSGAFRDFDFWIGTWTIDQKIRNADGGWIELPATTQVSASPDGCVLSEHWAGDVQFFWEGMTAPEHMWGHSVRRFDPKKGIWAIYWMDSRDPTFDTPHVGAFNGGRGDFFREFSTPEGPQRSRISFERRAPDHVYWELAISADAEATFAPVWTMDMRR